MGNLDFVLQPEALLDVKESYDWYESQSKGLGEEFLKCLDECLLRIGSMPEMYPILFDNVRRALVRRFPLMVIYEVKHEQILVHYVFHCSQDPQRIHRRLD